MLMASSMQTSCICCGSTYFWPFGGTCPKGCDPDAKPELSCPQCGHIMEHDTVELFDGSHTRLVCDDCGHVWDAEETAEQ